ncbi:MAG TPA: hydroxyisourate hydrolase [Candidatus Dormibacteraeota bacterium]|nr:hydroxyisourate hydrolase [Candidatus Dormibacteraeota bacterium]
MNTITTHVLDLSRGEPAARIDVRLECRADDGASWQLLAQAATDDDGRVRDWPEAPEATAGTYRLTFATAGRFKESFYPEISVTFQVKDAAQRYHVPILLGPFGYTTYRGS